MASPLASRGILKYVKDSRGASKTFLKEMFWWTVFVRKGFNREFFKAFIWRKTGLTLFYLIEVLGAQSTYSAC